MEVQGHTIVRRRAKDGTSGLDGKPGADGKPGKDANLLPWVEEWNNNKTLIKGEYIISPKMFSGTNSGTSDKPVLTGIAMGEDCLTDADGNKRTGIFALVNNEIVFELDPISKKYKFTGRIESNSIVMDEFAKLASAVFKGDFMFSQFGIDSTGKETNEYNKYGTNDFSPNLEIDFNKGKLKGKTVELEGIITGGYQNKYIPVDMTAMSELLIIDLSKGSDYMFYVNKGGGEDVFVSIPTDKKYIGVTLRISLRAIEAYGTITFRRAVYRLRNLSSDQIILSINGIVDLVGVPSVGRGTTDNPSGVGDTCEWRIINSGDFEEKTNTAGKVYFQNITN